MTKVRSGGCTIFIYYWNHITRGDCIYFLNFLIFFSSPLLILSVMTKKIVEWKRALTNELDENGWSPLHFAAYVGCHPTIVRQLLEQSDRDVVYLSVKDHGNRTALHIAAS